MKPNMSVPLRCCLTQLTGNGLGKKLESVQQTAQIFLAESVIYK